jgi:membrane protein DedA with SNARE-associated domain
MTLSVSGIVAFIAHHSEWAFPVMFITAFGESFVFLSLLFPGTTIMVAAGLLIPDGTLPLFPVLAGAILGATTGDTISWWLGARYGDELTRRWPLSRYPELIGRGEAFFERFGTLSVFVGRFFGPLRATIPLVAGMLKMPSRTFWIANVTSAFVWAPALLIPGLIAVRFSRLSGIPPAARPYAAVAAIAVILGAVWLLQRFRWFGLFDRWRR